MADMIPKLKLYLYFTFVAVIMSVVSFTYQIFITGVLTLENIAGFVGGLLGSFVPFVSAVQIALSYFSGVDVVTVAILTSIAAVIGVTQFLIVTAWLLSSVPVIGADV